MVCPKCGEDLGRRVERVGAVDELANWFFFKPYSCQGCGRRFYRLRRDFSVALVRHELRERLAARSRTNRKRDKREFVIYAFAAAAVIAVIYLLVQQRA